MEENVNYKPIAEPSQVKYDTNTITVYKRRYLVLFVLAASLFCNGEAWMTFGSVSSKSELYYNKSTSDIELFGTIFLIAYATVALPCTFMPKVVGLKWTLVGGCCFNFLGALLRLISLLISDEQIHNNYIIAITGNVLFGFAMGFLFSLPTLVSAVWFRDNERSMSTAISYMANAIGVGIGFLDIFLVMGNASEQNIIKNSFFYIAIAEITLNFLIFACSFFAVSEQPPTPPSKSELERRNIPSKIGVLQTINEIFKTIKRILFNFHALVALIIFSFNYGCYVIIFMFLSTIIETFSQSTTNLTGYIGAIGVIIGGTVTLIFGVIMNKTKNRYNRQIGISVNLLCAIPLSIVLILIARTLLENISASFLFIFYLAFSPVYISVGCEILADITYPADANISSSLALIIGNLFGSIAARLLGTMTTDFKYNLSIGLCIGLYFTSALLLLIKFRQNRSKVEQNLTK